MDSAGPAATGSVQPTDVDTRCPTATATSGRFFAEFGSDGLTERIRDSPSASGDGRPS